MKRDGLLPLAAMERIMKNAGARRVSEPAKAEMKKALEEIAKIIGEKAAKMASHAGRITIKSGDIRLASDQFRKY